MTGQKFHLITKIQVDGVRYQRDFNFLANLCFSFRPFFLSQKSQKDNEYFLSGRVANENLFLVKKEQTI